MSSVVAPSTASGAALFPVPANTVTLVSTLAHVAQTLTRVVTSVQVSTVSGLSLMVTATATATAPVVPLAVTNTVVKSLTGVWSSS
jgi:hypothetical protein